MAACSGESIAKVIPEIDYSDQITFGCARAMVDLPPRTFPTVGDAQKLLAEAAQRLESLRQSQADRREVRTAECDWFGAEETLALAQAAADGRLHDALASALPAEIMLMRIGHWSFVGWPGEAFVEFSLKLKAARRNSFVISLANGDLQGYLVTEEAVREKWYEAMNSLFCNPEAGMILVSKSLELLDA